MSKHQQVVYNGALYCSPCCSNCPEAKYDPIKGTVTIADPAKPQNGSFTMSTQEWNALVTHGKPIG
ncbi:hypothetical protein GF380_00045 [Candidatus Uhrbacteria bacterium]|nr:hypothetical protein [Candidatus Uhrbacteria bacterium]